MTQKARDLIKEINVEFENEYKPRLEALEKATADGTPVDTIKASIDAVDNRLNAMQRDLDAAQSEMKSAHFGGEAASVSLEKEYAEIVSAKLLKSKSPSLTTAEQAVVAEYTKSMNVGTANNGGVLVPTDTATSIQRQIEAIVPFLAIANVRQTSFAETSFLVQTGKSAAAAGTETSGASDTTAPTIEEVLIRAGHIEAEPHVTRELLEDSAVDVMSFIQSDIAETIGDTFGAQIVAALLAAGGATSAFDTIKEVDAADAVAAGAFTLDDLYDVKYDLDRRYKLPGQTAWVMGDEAMKIMRKLKDNNGQYLWQASSQVGEPNVFDGEPVYFTPNMPAIAGSADVDAVMYGNFNKGLGIVQNVSGNFIVVDEITNKKYVKFYTKQRWGAGVVDGRALRILRTAAAA